MNALVSIVMPAYNCEPYIEKAISSILNQTYQNFELVICDDGSTDQTWKIIDTFSDKRLRKYKNTSNKGYLFTYNFLLSATKGDFITCQDADDWSLPERIKRQMEVFDRHPDVFLCGCNGVFYYTESMQRHCPEFVSGFVKLAKSNFNFMLPSVVYRREILSSVNGFNLYFDRLTGMDQYFVLSIISNYKAYELNEYFYYARFNPSSNHRTLDNTRKLLAADVYFLLRNQRVESGSDWLLEERYDKLRVYEESLLKNRPFMAEKYREYAVYRIDSGEFLPGIKLIIKSLVFTPFWFPTYRTLLYSLRRLIATR
jgi:glycosyltransferase involved in cell wall biosynthesis